MLNTIMLIDDSDVDLLFTSVIVRRAGIAAHGLQFQQAEQALDFLRRGAAWVVDAILLDRHMPGLDGFGFLDVYEEMLGAGTVHAPVTLLTGSGDPDDLRRARSYRCVCGVVAKPLDIKSALGLAARVALDSRALVGWGLAPPPASFSTAPRPRPPIGNRHPAP